MAEKKKKKFEFNLYEFFNKGNGKGVSKEERKHPRNLKYFFRMLRNNLTNLLYINFYLVFGNFPIFFIFLALGYTIEQIPAPSSPVFTQIYGAITQSGVSNAATAAFYGIYGVRSSMNVPTTATFVFLALSLLVIFTFGLVNVGTTYLLRNIVKGDPISMWHDFWYAIKKNWKQGFIMGIIDIVLIAIFLFNIYTMRGNTQSYIFGLIFYGNILMLLIYMVMRFYSYILIVTFDLSLFKILKNSLIFSVLGFKRNFMAFLGIVAIIFIELAVFSLAQPIGLVLPFFLVFGIWRFAEIYAAYPKIKEVMIDPYYTEEEEDDEAEEPIFKDMG